MRDCTLQPSTTGLDKFMGFQGYSSCHKTHEPWPTCQWLCPCMHTLEQGLSRSVLMVARR